MTRFTTLFQVSGFVVGKLKYKKEKCTKEVRSSILWLVYKFTKNMGRTDFSDQFRKIIIRHKSIGYDFNVM